MSELDIAEVADRTGLAPSALRYYETKGLIRSVGRHGLRRQYKENVVELLSLIGLGRKAGFTLQDIAKMFAPAGQPHINRHVLKSRAHEIDKKIKELSATRDLLHHVANCPHESHFDCAKFRQLLRVAGKAPF